jgi:hypothetical protein
MTADGYPDFIFNSPQDSPALQRVFGYEAKFYDLNAYEAICPGFGKRIWALVEAERERAKAPLPRPKPLLRGPAL